MKNFVATALNAAQVKGASYADVRLDERVQQDITVKNGQLAAVSDDASEGLGVRVLVDGAWGFAGSARLDENEVELVVERAIRIARASARARSVPVDLGPPVTSRGHYRTPVERDPFTVPLSEKVELLLRADQAMGSVKGVTIREGSMEFIRQKKVFASTEGALTEQELFESGAGIEATAAGIRVRPATSTSQRCNSTGTDSELGRKLSPCSRQTNVRVASRRSSWMPVRSRFRFTSPAGIRLNWTVFLAWRRPTRAPVS